MEQDGTTVPPAANSNAAELAFRRYEARLGFWKVVLGTFIVGLAGVLIPGAVSFYAAPSWIWLGQGTAQICPAPFFHTAVGKRDAEGFFRRGFGESGAHATFSTNSA